MSRQRKQALIEMFETKAIMARTMGLKLEFDDTERAVVRLGYNPSFDNAFGDVHGGAIATMVDIAGWFTAAATVDEVIWVATSEMSVHLLRPSGKSDLTARGELLKRGKRQAVCSVRVVDDQGRLVAHGTGTFVYLWDVPMRID